MPITIIDELTSNNGWQTTGTIAVTNWEHLTAGTLQSQLLFEIPAGEKAELIMSAPVDVTHAAYTAVSLYAPVIRQEKRPEIQLSIEGGGVLDEFRIEIPGSLDQVRVAHTVTQIERVIITNTGDRAIKFFASGLISFTDRLPMDIYQGVQEWLERSIAPYYGKYSLLSQPVGVATCSAGDRKITIKDARYLQRYSCFSIGNERHRIADLTEQMGGSIQVQLAPDTKKNRLMHLTGNEVQGNYVDEPVYLFLPVMFEPRSEDIVLPGFAIYNGFSPRQDETQERHTQITHSEGPDGSVVSGTRGGTWIWDITIEAMGGKATLDEILLQILRRACDGMKPVYINYRPHEFHTGEIKVPDYGDPAVFITKMVVDCEITTTEESWQEKRVNPLNPVLTVQAKPVP